ncbi:sugar ABC transporter ATP-binding protein [Microbacterium sp. LWH3-1.2]|uniref:sugar ABC transporter ATP-binding protein n=1 Tax=Microbacterium sp. LWH3-1.2 TaxID=3135256 RepID=UPI003440C035
MSIQHKRTTQPPRPVYQSRTLLKVEGLTKSYGQTQALDGVDFELRAGEVMALLGENGAGKSTMVKTFGGLVQPDGGTITIAGQTHQIGSPLESQRAGIAIVQQELSLVETLSAVENIFVGTRLSGPWSPRRLAVLARPHLELVGLEEWKWFVPVAQLTIAERQLIEIARVVSREARIIVFDEPTAALADVETERVLGVVRRLVDAGHGVIYVTHRLREVYEIADRATVVRGGRSAPPVLIADTPLPDLVEMMLGRSLGSIYPPKANLKGAEARMTIVGLRTAEITTPVDLTVRRGEIVGLVGQIGSGAPSLARSIAGRDDVLAGSIRMGDEEIAATSVRSAIKAGIAYCSDDRKRDGFFFSFTVTDNFASTALRSVSRWGWYRPRVARALARSLASKMNVAHERLGTAVGALSGGNQQKVVLGKWLAINPRVLLIEEPTRGVDIGARAEIYTELRRLADEGIIVVFASSDTSEALGLADTVLTFYRGALVRSAPAAELDEVQLLIDVTHGKVAA